MVRYGLQGRILSQLGMVLQSIVITPYKLSQPLKSFSVHPLLNRSVWGIGIPLMLTTEGTVYGSGANGGQLPDGTTESRSIFKAIENTDGSILTGVRDAQAKWDQSVFLMEDGTALTAGGNLKGALGDGTMTAKSEAAGAKFRWYCIQRYQIGRLELSLFSLPKSDGTAWSTGWNTDGRLGDGTTTDRPTGTSRP